MKAAPDSSYGGVIWLQVGDYFLSKNKSELAQFAYGQAMNQGEKAKHGSLLIRIITDFRLAVMRGDEGLGDLRAACRVLVDKETECWANEALLAQYRATCS